ncbi:MAG: (2Fe-2S)-binding protein, partial [Oscillospiraceae bacterium]|nr:(2Fe-2S)-binding protein [Oscillospiraceae bacterium]
MKKLTRKALMINGVERFALCELEKDSLAEVLRRLGLTGVKVGCGTGVCGACSVILNGEVIRSCTRKMKNVPDHSEITTIEGIGTPQHLHPLQQAWVTYGAAQCGFCSPGFIVSAYGLLQENINPTREDVREWFRKHHNVCRCTGYKPLVDAVMAAAKCMRGECTMEDLKFDPTGKDIYGSAMPRPTGV